MLSEKERDRIFHAIWNKRTTERKLPLPLYKDIGNGLRDAWIEGVGNANMEVAALEVAAALNQNIYAFSAAKTFQQVKDMQNFIVDSKGIIRPFRDFFRDIKPLYDQYNVEWLRTEFDTTIAQAQNAAKWQDIQADKDIFPNLQYITAGDTKVRPEHAEWDGIIRPVDDPFWFDHYPPNGYSCRCDTIKLEADKQITDISNVTTNQEKLFKMNPGQDALIFKEVGSEKHPYFKVENRFEVHRGKNFGLPLPEGTDPL